MSEHNTVKLALLAGARAIENNNRLHGATYVLDPMGESLEISYYQAGILLRLMSECVAEDGIDTKKMIEFAGNIDNYGYREGKE